MALRGRAGAILIMGSALTQKRRPLSSVTLAIWAFAVVAPSSAETAQKAPKTTEIGVKRAQNARKRRWITVSRGRLNFANPCIENGRSTSPTEMLGVGPGVVDSTN